MTLHVRQLHNQIDKRSISPPVDVEWEGRTIYEVASDLGVPEDCARCVVNDTVVPAEEWRSARPEDGSTLTFVQTETSDVFDKIVNVLTRTTFLYFFKDFFRAPSSPTTPDQAEARQAGEGGFGFSGLRNADALGAPIPIVYGEHDVAGVVISSYRYASPNNSEWINYILALSEGPIKSVGQYTSAQRDLNVRNNDLPTGMLINGQSADNFSDVQVEFNLGTLTQDPLDSSHTVTTGYDVSSFELREPASSAGADFIWHTFTPVDVGAVNVRAPQGIYKLDEEGNSQSHSIQLRMTAQAYDTPGGTLQVVKDQVFTLTANRRGPLYWTLTLEDIRAAADALGYETDRFYLVLFRYNPLSPAYKSDNRTQDQIEVIGVNEGRYAALAYPNVATAKVAMLATEELGGQAPTVTFRIKGRTDLWTPSGTAYSNNPASVVYDLLTNERFGLGSRIPTSMIDEDSFETWYNYNAASVPTYTGSGDSETRNELNVVIDSRQSAWELILQMASVGRAALLKVGSSIKAKVEQQKTASQMFTEGNIVRDSLQVNYTSRADRPNVVEVSFLNEDDNFAQDQVTAEWESLILEDVAVRKVSTRMPGITRETQARRAAFYQLRAEQYIRRTVSFEAPVDSIVSEPGDVIKVAHTLPNWAESGRIQDADGASITLDVSVTFEAGVVYTYLERDDDGTINTQDFTASGTTNVLSFVSPGGATGAVGRIWAIGRKGYNAREYLVTAISTGESSSFTRRIEAIEYNPDVYTDDSGPVGGDLFVPSAAGDPDPASNVAVAESYVAEGVSKLTVTWDASSDASFYVAWEKHGTTSGDTEYTQIATTATLTLAFNVDHPMGTVVTVAVQAVGATGNRDDVANAPTGSVTIARDDDEGEIATFPAVVTNLALAQTSGTEYELTWDAVSGAESYEVRADEWPEGVEIASGVATAATVYLNQLARDFHVRAKIGGVYSPEDAAVTSGTEQLGSYSTSEVSVDEDWSAGTINNMVRQQWSDGNWRLIQAVSSLQCSYLTATQDLGISKTVHVSAVGVVLPYITTPGSFLATAQHISAYGGISKRYVTWTAVLEYSTDASTWSEFDLKANYNADSTVTGRYFRVRLTGQRNSALDTSDIPSRVMFQELKLKLYS